MEINLNLFIKSFGIQATKLFLCALKSSVTLIVCLVRKKFKRKEKKREIKIKIKMKKKKSKNFV